MSRRRTRREISIRGTEDLLEARERLRELAREVGCDLMREAKLVAGLSDLAERFYIQGRAGRLVLDWDGACLEAVLEHEPAALPTSEPCVSGPPGQHADDFLQAALGGVRFMWDDVAVESPSCLMRVVLRSWPTR